MHIDSHYAAHLGKRSEFDTLVEHKTTDTCVIGAGLGGLTTARELARAGHDVILLEAELVGWGASGRNGGFVSAGFARSNASIAEEIGWEDTQNLYRQSVHGRDYVKNTIGELGLVDVILGDGWLKLLRHKNTDELRQYSDLAKKKLDVDLEFIEKGKLDNFVVSDKYHGGLLDPQAFHIQPLKYACGLADDIVKHGGKIYENSRCLRLHRQKLANKNENWLVETANGTIGAQNVVLATSSYNGPFKKLNSAMLPVATYVLSSKPCGSLLDQLIPFTGCICDTRRSGDYYRTIRQGQERRLIWGGRITTMQTQPIKLAQMLKGDIESVYPSLDTLKVERAWSGLMGYCTHKMPIICKLDDELWAASAFGGHGLNTTAMAGLLVSAAILHGDDEYRRFSPFGIGSFGGFLSGGVFGKLAVQLEYWRLQFLDRLDERAGG